MIKKLVSDHELMKTVLSVNSLSATPLLAYLSLKLILKQQREQSQTSKHLFTVKFSDM